MAKYTNMAGFKGVSENDKEEASEKLPRPLFFLIIGGVAVVIFVAFLIVHAFSSNHGDTATTDEAVRFGRNDRTERADYAQTSILFAINDDCRPAANHAAGDNHTTEK